MLSLDDLGALRRVDRSDMLGKASVLAEQCLDGWQRGLGLQVPRAIRSCRQILVLGVGGSAIGADLLQGFLADTLPRPVFVQRNYSVPDWVGPDTLGLACSYSGNTEETLSAAEQARRRRARMLAVTSGGRLVEWARRHRLPQLALPQGLPPRAAVGYQAFVPLGLLARLGWVSRRGLPVERACRGLRRWIRTRLNPEVPLRDNPAKKLASRLAGRLPILYGAAGGWEGVTYRWRTQFEENSKSLAFHHLFPEATHNEISGWREPRALMARSTAIFLRDPAIHPRTRRRMDFTRRIIRAQGVPVLEAEAPGASRLERMLGLVALGDFASIYLGILYRVDPTPVERVEALKKFMVKGER